MHSLNDYFVLTFGRLACYRESAYSRTMSPFDQLTEQASLTGYRSNEQLDGMKRIWVDTDDSDDHLFPFDH